MTLDIFDKDGKEKKFWLNFRRSVVDEWPSHAVERIYNATFVGNDYRAYLDFENDRDATLFLLRWT